MFDSQNFRFTLFFYTDTQIIASSYLIWMNTECETWFSVSNKWVWIGFVVLESKFMLCQNWRFNKIKSVEEMSIFKLKLILRLYWWMFDFCWIFPIILHFACLLIVKQCVDLSLCIIDAFESTEFLLTRLWLDR